MTKKRTALKLYKSYMFRDKDPVIDVVRTVVEDSGKPWAVVQRESGVSRATLRNWFLGDTKRPQFATIAAVCRSCGQDVSVGRTAVRPIRVVSERQRRKA